VAEGDGPGDADFCYERRFSQREVLGLTNQIRRAAVSIPCNIAEGQGRRSPRDFNRFLLISNGSLQELETQVMIAARLNFMNSSEQQAIVDLASEVGRLMNDLSKSLAREN